MSEQNKLKSYARTLNAVRAKLACAESFLEARDDAMVRLYLGDIHDITTLPPHDHLPHEHPEHDQPRGH